VNKAELQAELARLQSHLVETEVTTEELKELEARASELAAPQDEQTDRIHDEYLLVQSGGQQVLLELAIVFRIAARPHSCRIPPSKTRFTGLVARDGELLPFMTIGESTPDPGSTGDQFFVAVGIEHAEFAILADSEPERLQVEGVISLTDDNADGYISKVAPSGIGVVDSQRLLNDRRLWTAPTNGFSESNEVTE